jgi:NAD-dependent dihydropyrimidine dehydrogenase PreA subunit
MGMTEKGKIIKTLYCNCSYYDFIPRQTKDAVLDAMVEVGLEFEPVTDLCSLAAGRDPKLKQWTQAESIRIIACFPRAIKWLFYTGHAPLPPEKATFFNMRTQRPEDIIAGLLAEQTPGKKIEKPVFQKEDWIPWFPVIDYDRCKNCKQCMNFCLFGVYELSTDGRVEVTNPDHCKTNCPACARLCPHSAIIFPKYSDAPVNGEEITEESSPEQQPSRKLSKALQGDVYDAIRQRSDKQKRFSTDSPSTMEKLRRELDIPADVLTSLTPSEMQRIRKKSGGENTQKTPDESGGEIIGKASRTSE